MKIKLFLFVTITSFFNLNAQTEMRVCLNSGLFSYSGLSAHNTTQLYLYDHQKTGYAVDPYGAQQGLSYGFSFNIKSISKNKTIIGFDAGYEVLKSSAKYDIIHNVDYTPFFSSTIITVDAAVTSGETILTNHTLNLNPFVGHRFNTTKNPIDVVAGFDVCYIMKAQEKGVAFNGDPKYTSKNDVKTINFDFRPRVQISVDFSRIGIYLGYSYGLINHSVTDDNINSDVTSRFVRFGATYLVF